MHARARPRQAQHCIDDVAVEFEFGNARLEAREQLDMVYWLSNDLLPALDELFSYCAPGEQVIRFEQLVFDFGRLPARDYRQIIREQLLQKLARLIGEQRLPIEPGDASALLENRLTDPALALPLLLDYLRTGQLGAQAFPSTTTGINSLAPGITAPDSAAAPKFHQQLLESLVAEHHIAAQLRALPNRDQWLARLLKQFSERHRSALLRQFAPDQLAPALVLLDLLQTAPVAGANQQVASLWQALLDVALDQPAATAQDWFNLVMHKWLRQVPELGWAFIRYAQALQAPDAIHTSTSLPTNWQWIQTFADTMLREKTAQETGVPNNPPAAADKAPTSDKAPTRVGSSEIGNQPLTAAVIQQTLSRLLASNDAQALMAHWQGWQQQHRQLLVAGLIEQLSKVDARQELLAKLPTAFIGEMLALLAPDLKPLLHSLASNTRRYRDALDKVRLRLEAGDSPLPGISGTNETLDQWLRLAYDVIAARLVAQPQASRAGTPGPLSPTAVLAALAAQVAEQQPVPVDELYSLWEPIYVAGAGPGVEVAAVASSLQDQVASSGNIQQQIARLLVQGAASEWIGYWPQWKLNHTQLLIAGVKHYLVNAELRQQLLLRLPPSLIGELLALVAPDVQPLVDRLAENADKLIGLLEQLATSAPVTTPTLVTISTTVATPTPVATSSGSRAWLQRLYELLATQVFARVSDDTPDTIALPPLDQLGNELILRMARQHDLPSQGLSGLRQLLLPGQGFVNHPPTDPVVQPAAQSPGVESPGVQVEAGPGEKIRQIFAQKDVKALEQSWPYISSMLSAQPEQKVAIALAACWRQAELRRAFLSGLSLPVLTALLAQVAPAYQQWFARVAALRVPLLQEAQSLEPGGTTGSPGAAGIPGNSGNPGNSGSRGNSGWPSALQALDAESWLRECFALSSALLWDSSATGNPVLSSATVNLLQGFTRRFANKYQLPAEPLYFLWQRILETNHSAATASPTAKVSTTTATAADSMNPTGTMATIPAMNPPEVISTAEVTSTIEAVSAFEANIANGHRATSVGQLMAQSNHELFDWCMALKSNPVMRVRLPQQVPLITRLIDSFVQYSPNFSPEFRSYFLAAIQESLASVSAPAEFLRRVLFALVDDELIDLDAIASALGAGQGAVAPAVAAANPAATRGESTGQDSGHQQRQSAPPQTEQRLAQLQEELHGGRINPFGLRMSLYYWQRLVEQFFQSPKAGAGHYSALVDSIRQHAQGAVDPNYFYQQVIHALVKGLPLDMDVFSTQAAADHPLAHLVAGATTAQGRAMEANMPISQPLGSADAAGLADVVGLPEPITESSPTIAPDPRLDSSIDPAGFSIDPAGFPVNPADLPINPPDSRINAEPSGSDDSMPMPELTLEQLLRQEAALNNAQLQQLQQHVNLLLHHFTQAQAQEWLRVLQDPLCAQRLIQQVPGHLLHQIVQRLQGAPFAALDPLVKLATEALALLAPNADPLAIKQARWEFVFVRLFGPANPLDAAELLKRCCEQLAQALHLGDGQRLLQLAERRLALLKPVAAMRPSMALDDGHEPREPALNFAAGIHLNNVGMVLAAPFLPRLFSMVNLLEEGKFIGPEAADRAVHLLQFMVTGHSETPEYELVLNKILCGISTSMPISQGITVSEQEKNIIEQMLQSMIQHWRALGSTSIAGLRETFLQRQGWLILDDEYWRLKVQERTFDMLLDRLPWTISLIKHAWMDKPLRVSWREQT